MRRNTRAIRLAGRPVLSLSTFQEPDHTAGGGGLVVDWPSILKVAGFDCEESAVLIAGVHGVTRTELADHLGWEDHKAEAVRKRARRKLNKLGLQFNLPTVLSPKAKIGKARASDPSRSTVVERVGGGLIWRYR
jgi:hypothetical protein